MMGFLTRVRALVRFVPYYRHQLKLSGDHGAASHQFAAGYLADHVPYHVEVGDFYAKQAFAVKSNWELFRGWLVFKLFTYDSLVDNSFKVSGTRTLNIINCMDAAVQNLGKFLSEPPIVQSIGNSSLVPREVGSGDETKGY